MTGQDANGQPVPPEGTLEYAGRRLLVAIDAGSYKLGIAIVDLAAADAAAGSYTALSLDLAGLGLIDDRVRAIGAALAVLLDRLRRHATITGLVAEIPDLGRQHGAMKTNPTSLRALYTVYGTILEIGRARDIPCWAVDPRPVREMTTRRATGSKREQHHYLARLGYHLPTRPPGARGRRPAVDQDAADALALAVTARDEIRLNDRLTVPGGR